MDANPPLMEPAEPTTVVTTSLIARIFNVIAAPGEVFDEVKVSKPSAANWLVPILLGFLMASICVVVLYSQAPFLQKIHEKQTAAIEKKVKAGKMTEAQATQAEAMISKFSGPTVMTFFGILGAAVIVIVHFFWLALVVWLIGKFFLKAEFSYHKAMEITGLASMIGVLAGLFTTLLTAYFGDLTPLNLALLDRQGDPASFTHLALGLVDFFDLWLGCVIVIGLSRVAGLAWSRAALPVAAYWLIMDAIIVTLGWGFGHLGS